VTSLVPAAGGTFTIRGTSTSADGAGYFSKEGSTTSGPRLTLTCGSAGSSDLQAPSVPGGVSATPASTSVALSWAASTDNVGVDHYNVYRDGATTPLANPTTASYTDSGLTPSTNYRYEVTAVDAAGNESAKSAAVTTTTTAGAGGGGTVQAQLLADRTIDPASTAPASTRLKVDAASPQNDMLMKFAVPTSCTSVAAASLRLTVGSGSTDPSVRGGDFYATDPASNPDWSEASVVWNTAPARTGAPVSLTTGVALNTSYDINVTSLVPAAGGTFTIRGTSTSADGAGYFSKEGSTTSGPRLTLTCG